MSDERLSDTEWQVLAALSQNVQTTNDALGRCEHMQASWRACEAFNAYRGELSARYGLADGDQITDGVIVRVAVAAAQESEGD